MTKKRQKLYELSFHLFPNSYPRPFFKNGFFVFLATCNLPGRSKKNYKSLTNKRQKTSMTVKTGT